MIQPQVTAEPTSGAKGDSRDKTGSSAALAAWYEDSRRQGLRLPFPQFIRDGAGEDWLDQADPKSLPDAADAILLAQAARLAIRSAARLEAAWKDNHLSRDELRPVPADEVVRELTRERDRAAGYFYDLRRRQAKLEHLDHLNRRAREKSIPERVEIGLLPLANRHGGRPAPARR